MVECCIRIALGEEPDLEQKWSKGSAIRYFEQRAGIVKSIDGIEDAEKMAGIKQISVVHNVGEKVTEINSSGARMGFVIAQDENADIAVKDCYDALEKIKVVIE